MLLVRRVAMSIVGSQGLSPALLQSRDVTLGKLSFSEPRFGDRLGSDLVVPLLVMWSSVGVWSSRPPFPLL